MYKEALFIDIFYFIFLYFLKSVFFYILLFFYFIFSCLLTCGLQSKSHHCPE